MNDRDETLRQDVRAQCPDVDPDVIDDAFAQLDSEYFHLFSASEIATHINLLSTVDSEHPVQVRITPSGADSADIILVAYDLFGEFSLITGLMAAHHLNIYQGQVFSYRRGPGRTTPWGHTDGGIIVDLFRVSDTPTHPFDHTAQTQFKAQLSSLIQLLRQGQLQQAREALNYQLTEAMRLAPPAAAAQLSPVTIRIDNESSPDWTVVDISAADTPGFLYSLSNALAMRQMYIHRVAIHSHEGKVQDQLHLGWRRGGKIRSPEGLSELRLIVTLIKQFTNFIYHAPDPAKALRYFDQLMDRLSNDGSFNDTFPWLWEAESLKALATVLGSSDFLWEDLLRQQYATLLPVLKETIARQPSPDQAELAEHLEQALQCASTEAEQKDCLNTFKDRELFRIDMRHLLHPELPFGQFSEDLSDLAEVVMRAALALVQQRLQPRYGLPFLADGQPCPFALCALGKFGGRELGYASDIELHCVYGGQGRTDGPEPIAVSEYAERLVRQLLDLIVARSSGIFELDLRLRPFGSKGPLAISEEAFRTYYYADGSAAPFERQALIKLRWVAGSESLGRRIEAWRDQFVYSPAPFDLEAAVALRQRQIDELVTPGTLDAKYSRGGLVDIEYTVQYLQLLHGPEQPLLRTPNTLCALEALHQTGYVQQTEYETLTAAYVFLRHLIDALRIVRGHARDLVLPAPDTEESTFLARRMGYWDGPEPTAQLFSAITHHMQATAQIYHDRFMLARSDDAPQ